MTSQLTDPVKWLISNRFNRDSCAYTNPWQRIHDIKMSEIDTCKTLLNIFVYRCGWNIGAYLFWQRWTNVRNPGVVGFYFKIQFHWWTRKIIHDTKIVVDVYTWIIKDETHHESFYHTFVADVNLPHQNTADGYDLAVYIMYVDALLTQGARTSIAMVFTQPHLSRNTVILFPSDKSRRLL